LFFLIFRDLLIGNAVTTLDQLFRGVGALNSYKLSQSDRRKKDHSSVELIDLQRIPSLSFIDFITAGTQIHFSVAVDFTASNGNPLHPSSLHYIHPHKYNPYMKALCAISNVIGKYNKQDRIAAFGFGAQTPPKYELSHFFYMNGDSKDAHVDGVDGLLSAYRSCLLTVRPYAPTDYSEVIYHVYKFGAAVQRQRASNYYFILLIVTDGYVTDQKKTIDAVVKCSYLPISIIMVGVGKRDYLSMQQLLSPLLKSSDGLPLKREIITFVPFTEDLSDKDLVAKLLLNIPRQFLSWASLSEKIVAFSE
uniref:VWFA domain-containing protein n=1 Tax=Dracunculus medinensis TaxID=318479 RepID=A0A0N4U9J4_DRAME